MFPFGLEGLDREAMALVLHEQIFLSAPARIIAYLTCTAYMSEKSVYAGIFIYKFVNLVMFMLPFCKRAGGGKAHDDGRNIAPRYPRIT